MIQFLFAKNLSPRHQALDGETLENLQKCLKNCELPNGSRCLRSDIKVLKEIIRAKNENRYIPLEPKYSEPITVIKSDENRADAIPEVFAEENIRYVAESEPEEDLETSSISSEKSETESITPRSGYLSPWSPEPEIEDAETQTSHGFRGPNDSFHETRLSAISSYYEAWYVNHLNIFITFLPDDWFSQNFLSIFFLGMSEKYQNTNIMTFFECQTIVKNGSLLDGSLVVTGAMLRVTGRRIVFTLEMLMKN